MKHFTFLILIILGAFTILGFLTKSQVVLQDQMEALKTKSDALEVTIESAATSLEASQAQVRDLELALVTALAQRDQAIVERDIWQAQVTQMEQTLREAQAENTRLFLRVQDLEKALQAVQVQHANSEELNTLAFIQHPWWVIIALGAQIVLVIFGYSGFRPKGKVQLPNPANKQPQLSADVVQVSIPRWLIPAYIRWIREAQTNRLGSNKE